MIFLTVSDDILNISDEKMSKEKVARFEGAIMMTEIFFLKVIFPEIWRSK